MSDFRRVCSLDQLEEGKTFPTEVDEYEILLVRSGDEVFALEDRCSHADIPLALGNILPEQRIKCQVHGAEFCLRTGKPLCAPAFAPVRTFAVKVEDDGVWVDVG